MPRVAANPRPRENANFPASGARFWIANGACRSTRTGAVFGKDRHEAFAEELRDLDAPILVNIFAFHAALDRGGLGMAVVLVALEIGLAYAHRRAYAPLLAAKTGKVEARAVELEPAPAE